MGSVPVEIGPMVAVDDVPLVKVKLPVPEEMWYGVPV